MEEIQRIDKMNSARYRLRRCKDKPSGKDREMAHAQSSDGPGLRNGRVRRMRTTEMTLEIESQLKERLQAVAEKRGCSLSYLVEQVIQDFVVSHEDGSLSSAS
jgi:predicted DNA-binding ribbon-helix-helix protein